jgi:hypothetical protein
MDPQDFYQQARQRFDHETARRVLREKYQAKLNFGFAGGMFKATPELMVFLATWPHDTMVLLDLYENPIEVNRPELLEIMQQRWQEQMNAWHAELQKLTAQR